MSDDRVLDLPRRCALNKGRKSGKRDRDPITRMNLEFHFDRDRLAIARMDRLARRRVLPLSTSNKLDRLPAEELRFIWQFDAGVELVVDLDESILPLARTRLETNLLARVGDALRATSGSDRWRELG